MILECGGLSPLFNRDDLHRLRASRALRNESSTLIPWTFRLRSSSSRRSASANHRPSVSPSTSSSSVETKRRASWTRSLSGSFMASAVSYLSCISFSFAKRLHKHSIEFIPDFVGFSQDPLVLMYLHTPLPEKPMKKLCEGH